MKRIAELLLRLLDLPLRVDSYVQDKVDLVSAAAQRRFNTSRYMLIAIFVSVAVLHSLLLFIQGTFEEQTPVVYGVPISMEVATLGVMVGIVFGSVLIRDAWRAHVRFEATGRGGSRLWDLLFMSYRSPFGQIIRIVTLVMAVVNAFRSVQLNEYDLKLLLYMLPVGVEFFVALYLFGCNDVSPRDRMPKAEVVRVRR